MNHPKQVIVKTYSINEVDSSTSFKKDVLLMAQNNYYPTTQSYKPGNYGCLLIIIVLLLCFLLIGIPIAIYMSMVKPKGVLVVSYEYRAPAQQQEEKTCPSCAEKIKLEAKICRFCNHSF